MKFKMMQLLLLTLMFKGTIAPITNCFHPSDNTWPLGEGILNRDIVTNSEPEGLGTIAYVDSPATYNSMYFYGNSTSYADLRLPSLSSDFTLFFYINPTVHGGRILHYLSDSHNITGIDEWSLDMEADGRLTYSVNGSGVLLENNGSDTGVFTLQANTWSAIMMEFDISKRNVKITNDNYTTTMNGNVLAAGSTYVDPGTLRIASPQSGGGLSFRGAVSCVQKIPSRSICEDLAYIEHCSSNWSSTTSTSTSTSTTLTTTQPTTMTSTQVTSTSTTSPAPTTTTPAPTTTIPVPTTTTPAPTTPTPAPTTTTPAPTTTTPAPTTTILAPTTTTPAPTTTILAPTTTTLTPTTTTPAPTTTTPAPTTTTPVPTTTTPAPTTTTPAPTTTTQIPTTTTLTPTTTSPSPTTTTLTPTTTTPAPTTTTPAPTTTLFATSSSTSTATPTSVQATTSSSKLVQISSPLSSSQNRATWIQTGCRQYSRFNATAVYARTSDVITTTLVADVRDCLLECNRFADCMTFSFEEFPDESFGRCKTGKIRPILQYLSTSSMYEVV